MNGTPPNDPQAPPSSRTAALLWAIAVVGVLAGLGLYLAGGDDPGSEPATTPAEAAARIAAAPDPNPTSPPPANFFTLTACRLFDGIVAAGDSVVDFRPDCVFPASAKTLAVAISVINPVGAGTLVLYPADSTVDAAGGAAGLEFQAGHPRNGSVYLPLPADGSPRVGVRNTGDAVRVILDLSGYFE